MYKNNFVVAIKCKGEVLRETGSDVYLTYGSEYSVMLKNKDHRQAVATISVDGVDALNGNSIVVPGNSTQEIKGFMRDMRETNRFKFIQKTDKIRAYRGNKLDDGLVKVSFRFEKEPDFDFTRYLVNNVYIDHGPTRYGSSTNANWYYDNSQSQTYGCSLNSGPVASFYNNTKCINEDGITVKGSKIRQDYQYTTVDNLEATSTVITLQLKGKTTGGRRVIKPITTKTKVQCEICGSKNRSANNFCWSCGVYLK